MSDLTAQFDEFIDAITLSGQQVARMDSAANAISRFLARYYNLSATDVFLQGSYANRTAIEPVDGGEYDVDIVCICADSADTANDALDDLEAAFKSDGNYANRIKRKTPCVRLEYAPDDVGKFHVDVVPVRPSVSGAEPLESPRRDDGWHDTAPAEYTAWCAAQGERYCRTVKAMKRWRDDQQGVRHAVKSIVLQVLIAKHMPTNIHEDAERLAATLYAMHADLGSRSEPPVVLNPVLPSENLAARWTQESFDNFKRELAEATETAKEAINAASAAEACDSWRAILGDDFPLAAPDSRSLPLGDYTHLLGTNSGSWIEVADARYGVTISATTQRGRLNGPRKSYTEVSKPIIAGNWICFQAHTYGPNDFQIWWQVGNTGGHARDKGALRGEFLRAKSQRTSGSSSDPAVHWERTEYTGSHLVRAVPVVRNVVVAVSPWLQVRIVNPRFAFRL